MNRLEQYIRENKSRFDQEPATDHFERLQQKISRKSGKIVPLRWIVSVAASIAILLAAGMLWNISEKRNSIVLCENVSDMKVCYLDKMYRVADRVERLIMDFDQWDRQEVLMAVQNIIDAVNDDFESEIPEELPDNRAKAILSDHYRKYLESLEMIAVSIMSSD